VNPERLLPDLATWPPLVVVVGGGGVGKTTLAASLGVASAEAGTDTLVMTFDPSLRLKDALGVGEDEARRDEVTVDLAPLGLAPDAPVGRLAASLLDARRTFDGLVTRYAPDPEARQRILGNRFYAHLAGSLGGILEYMAVERLFEVAAAGRYGRVILDTPPTRQALDFLDAPRRIMSFLDSGALRIALKPWFDSEGRLRSVRRLGFLGRGFEEFLDRVVGLDLLRDMAEFFQAFAPLYDGFRSRAHEVERLLRAQDTRFVLVSGPGEARVADTLFFARKLEESRMRLGPVVVNRIHPRLLATADPASGPEPHASGPTAAPGGAPFPAGEDDGVALLAWLGERDAAGLENLASLLAGRQLVRLPLLPGEPDDLPALADFARLFATQLARS
jgi:anion-transporting  ArsA/GET3 family ATPase